MSKNILTSIHGRRVGLSADGSLVLNGPNGAEVAVASINGGAMVRRQSTPGTLNATGTVTPALILTGIITSTTASAVTATLATGAALDAAVKIEVDDAIEWKVINTGSNNFTVQAATGHTIVGGAVVAGGASGRFLTRRTAANTFVTYRV
jgi:hypothetical protein